MRCVGESDQNSHSVNLAEVESSAMVFMKQKYKLIHGLRLDLAIQRINHYSVDNSVGFDSTYPAGSDLSVG